MPYTAKFIEALNKDMKSAKHSGEVGYQVLGAVVELLQEHRSECSLNLEQIMIGTLNMAISLHNFKYGIITPENIGIEIYSKFFNGYSLWYVGYNEALKTVNESNKYWQIAIPVIERAARSPLFITPCFSYSLQVYFEYLKHLDSNFIPPQLPTGNTFGPFSKEQVFSFNTAYSPTLFNLSLFAIKKNIKTLNLETLPVELATQVRTLDIFKENNETENQNNSPSSCCVII
jgi:hypothetical protein